MTAVDASLRRLKTDWIDLYQLHCPDPATPIEETLSALDDVVRQGKARYIGCSNLPPWQVVEAQLTAKHLDLQPFISCQDEFSLLIRHPESELLPAMQRYGLGLFPYYPLANGLLTGKYSPNAEPPLGSRLASAPDLANRYLTDRNWDILERARKFCALYGRTLLELAFAWLAAQPTVASIVAGATSAAQVEENVRAASWQLDAGQIDAANSITLQECAAIGMR
jgi:aryl-alcohol dehydrogenase-like predicted oxidoreductase